MTMRWKQIGAVLVVAASTTQCHAAHQTTAPACRIVQGEMSAWNGTPSLRISAAGRMFGIVHSHAHPLPPAIVARVNFTQSVIGRFTVCPVGKAEPDGMTYVWLKRAVQLRTVPAP
jgi:hypothetical protein